MWIYGAVGAIPVGRSFLAFCILQAFDPSAGGTHVVELGRLIARLQLRAYKGGV